MVVQNAQPPPKEEYRMRSGKVPVCEAVGMQK